MSASRNPRMIPAALAVAWVTACGSGAEVAPRIEVRDSAGVRIVENVAGAWRPGEEWRLSERPLLELGMIDGPNPYLFSLVAGVRRLSDGRLVVANGGSAELRFFAAGGAFLYSVGGQGSGPGEFRDFTMFQSLPGDTLLVFDLDLQRLSYVMPPEGRVESIPFAIFRPGLIPGTGDEVGPGVHLLPRPVGAMGGGSLLIVGSVALGRVSDGVHTYPMPFSRLDRQSSVATTLGEFPGRSTFVFSDGGWTTTTGLPFAPGPHYHTLPDGFVYGHSSRYEIRYHGATGDLHRIVRRTADPRPVTAADVERVVQSTTGETGDAAHRSRMGRMYAGMPIPEFHPYFDALLTDDLGNLWVAESSEGESSPWAVYDPDGRLLGEVRMPRRFRPTQITDELVIGTARDEMRVEYVRVYRLLRPR